VTELAVLVRVRAAVVVELDIESAEVADVIEPHIGDHRLFAAPFLTGADHDRGPVRVIRTEQPAIVPAQFLEPHPDVGLDVLDQMADVDLAVGVGQGGGDENLTGHADSDEDGVPNLSEGGGANAVASLSRQSSARQVHRVGTITRGTFSVRFPVGDFSEVAGAM